MKLFLRKIFCFAAFFLFFACSICFASGYPVSAFLGIDQGLSNNFVRCVYQDKNGFMWFGTYDGLNRYDGYEFTIFRNQFKNNRSLVNNWINAINEDTRGNLWIGTRQGACVYNSLSHIFSPLYFTGSDSKKQPLHSVIRDIEADAHGNMWVGTTGEGLLLFARGESTGRRILAEPANTLPYDVTAVKAVNDKAVWFFVSGKGLYRYEYATQQTTLANAVVTAANCMEAADGCLWLGTNEGLRRYNIAANTFDKIYNENNKKLEYNTVSGITRGNSNELWIATNGGGVVVLNTATDAVQFIHNTKETNSLSSNAATCIWIDKQSRKWIGTLRGGVNVVDPHKERFQNIVANTATGNTLISNYILSFYEAANKDLWIGTDGGGLSIWNRKQNSFTNYRHNSADPHSLSDNFVTDIQSDFEKNIWITTYRGGVNLFNNGNFEHYACVNPNNAGGFVNPIGPTFLEDAAHRIWLSTQQYGLFTLNREKKVFELFDSTLKDFYVLREDRNHVFWGGNSSQLVKIDRAAKKHVFYVTGKPITAIREDRSGNFWVGTEGGGLILFDRKQGKIIARYTTDEGLCSNSILNILEDTAGNLWMSTFNGIAKFNPRTQTVDNYYQGDGLKSNQFNYHAALQLQSGELAFGSINGFTLFRPENITANNSSPDIFLTDIKVGNTSPEEDASLDIKTQASRITAITIPYNKAVLSFAFAALEYSAPGKIQYAYYLEGWDRDWNYSGNNRKVVYSRLSEGTYTFRVKNTNAEGVWSKEGIRMTIVVLPPWYRSWWAYLLYITLLVAAVYYYLQYRARQTRLQYEVTIARLNEENARSEKERSLAELAKERAEREKAEVEGEKKIAFFTNISHEFRTPLTLIINPVKALLAQKSDVQKDNGDLNTVYRNARRMLSLVDQLLLFRKAESGLDEIHPSRLNLHDLAYDVYLCFVQQARTQRIHYVFDCANEKLEIYADREKLEIILYNLLSNALKYTAAGGSVTLAIAETAGEVYMKVVDNGAGIPAATGEKLFEKFYKAGRTKTGSKAGFGIGLYLVKHFTEQHKGEITYRSEEGHGTTFITKLLKGRAHFEPDVFISETEAAPQLLEVMKEEPGMEAPETGEEPLTELVSEKQSLLIIDDDEAIRQYITRLFKDTYIVYQAENGESGMAMAQKHLPDLIISDIHMKEVSGIDLCRAVKQNEQLRHIPVILLTGATSDELKLQGVEEGAEDYIVKPFDSRLLVARVNTLLRNLNTLQQYFYSEITLHKSEFRVSAEYREFLNRCIAIVEQHLKDKQFGVQTLMAEMGMSHSNLLRKVKSVSGQPVNIFIRSIRLRKAAELFIHSNYSIKETAYAVGIGDIKYFREQFHKLFGMNPSEYIRKYRSVHGRQYRVDKDSINPEN